MTVDTRNSALEAIGNTPLIQLSRVVPRAPPGSSRNSNRQSYGKHEDRMARALVERAAADGRLSPGGTVVEYTAGTRVSRWRSSARRSATKHTLCARTPSVKKHYTRRAYGADITDVRSDGKKSPNTSLRP